MTPAGEAGRQPRFSFLCTAYRTEQYLPATIDSVLAQTLADWELVVVDNGMSDEIAAIVLGYGDPRIHLVRQENRGLTGGVDAAAEVATGRWFCVLNSDDQLLPEFCARTTALLERYPDTDVVGIDAHVFDERDGQDQIRGYRQSVGITTPADPTRPVTLVEVVRGDVLYYTSAISAEAWRKGGGYACDTPRVADLALYLRLLAAGCEVRVLDERLARYRLRPDSLSRDPAEVEIFEDALETCFVRAAAASTDPRMPQALDVTLRRIRFDRAMRRARAALLHGDTRTAKEQARAALAQKRSARPAAVLAGLTVAPWALRRVHPAKQAVSRIGAGVARTVRRRPTTPG